MFVSQILEPGGGIAVVIRESSEAYKVAHTRSVQELAECAITQGVSMTAVVKDRGMGEVVDMDTLRAENRVLLPITHPDPTRLGIFGAGHAGTGQLAVAPGQPTPAMARAQRVGFSAGLVGVHVISAERVPVRVGFALGHLFVALSAQDNTGLPPEGGRTMPCASFGPEILVGDLPGVLEDTLRIWRDGEVLHDFTGHDFTGSSGLRSPGDVTGDVPKNLPGDVHVQFLARRPPGSDPELSLKPGDICDSSRPGFGLALRNPVSQSLAGQDLVRIEVL